MVTLKQVRDIPSIFQNPTPSLARITREHGEQTTIDFLIIWIAEMNELVNVSRPMNEKQIIYTARMVYQENPLLTIADIKLVFERYNTGYYGKDYNRIDTSVICGIFRQHWEDRINQAEQDTLSQHHYHTSDDPHPRFAEIQKLKEIQQEIDYFKTEAK